jgi:hypothetical protein
MADIYNLTDTWNSGGTTFTSFKMNVTDTASASGSKFCDFQISGTTKFKVNKTGAFQSGPGTIPSALVTYWTGGVSMAENAVPALFAAGATNWVGPTIIGFGDGAIANQGVTTTYPFVEFARSGGTNGSLSNIGTSWVIGEIAYVGYTDSAYQALVLIQGVTRSDDALKGQVNFVLGNSIDITSPAYTFNALQMWGRGSALFGSVSTKNSLTNGVQVSNTGATSNFNMVRATANTYAYYGCTPEVALDATHPHWGIGLYDSVYDLTFWSYNGSANSKRMIISPQGSVVVGDGANALATNATDGFLYIPTCAGTPTGTPTAKTGTVPIIFDTTNNKLYIYDGSWLGGTSPGAFT